MPKGRTPPGAQKIENFPQGAADTTKRINPAPKTGTRVRNVQQPLSPGINTDFPDTTKRFKPKPV